MHVPAYIQVIRNNYSMMTQKTQTKDLIGKIKTLISVRLILVTLVMVTGSFALRVEWIPFYFIFAVFYFLTFIYAVLLRTKFPLSLNAYIQIIIDIILETAIIHYAGGANSVYALLYAPSIVAGGVVVSSRAARTIAGLSSIFYGAVSWLEYFSIIKPVGGAEVLYKEGIAAVLFIISFRIIIFCLIGYLSSYLSYHLSRKSMELTRLRNLSDIILKKISSGVLTVDNNFNVAYVNPMAQKILEREEKDLFNRYWPSIFWERPEMEAINKFVINAKSLSGVEIDILKQDGKKIILNCTYSDLVDEKNNVIGGVLTFIDLTPLKELELEICQREKLSAMGEMAVSIAHEIRNPMASIRGAIEVLLEQGRFQGEGEKLVEVIFKEMDRLNHVIGDFLKYAKERKQAVKYEDLGKLIDEVWLLVKQGERWNKKIELEKKLNPEQIICEINQDQMKQVFYNLFVNALEAMPQGGKIQIDIKEESGKVIIGIKDNGIGISKEEIGRIFERFYSTKSYGLGMGLAITRKIIESYHGTITLASEQGKGTTVTIILPSGTG